MKAKYLLLIVCLIVLSGYTQAQSKTPVYFKYKCGMSKEEVESIEKRNLIFKHISNFGDQVYYLRNVDYLGKSASVFYYFPEKKLNHVNVIFRSDIGHPENGEQEFLKMKHRMAQKFGSTPSVSFYPSSSNTNRSFMDIILKKKGKIDVLWYLEERIIGLTFSYHFIKSYQLELAYVCLQKSKGLDSPKTKKIYF